MSDSLPIHKLGKLPSIDNSSPILLFTDGKTIFYNNDDIGKFFNIDYSKFNSHSASVGTEVECGRLTYHVLTFEQAKSIAIKLGVTEYGIKLFSYAAILAESLFNEWTEKQHTANLRANAIKSGAIPVRHIGTIGAADENIHINIYVDVNNEVFYEADAASASTNTTATTLWDNHNERPVNAVSRVEFHSMADGETGQLVFKKTNEILSQRQITTLPMVLNPTTFELEISIDSVTYIGGVHLPNGTIAVYVKNNIPLDERMPLMYRCAGMRIHLQLDVFSLANKLLSANINDDLCLHLLEERDILSSKICHENYDVIIYEARVLLKAYIKQQNQDKLIQTLVARIDALEKTTSMIPTVTLLGQIMGPRGLVNVFIDDDGGVYHDAHYAKLMIKEFGHTNQQLNIRCILHNGVLIACVNHQDFFKIFQISYTADACEKFQSGVKNAVAASIANTTNTTNTKI